MPGKSDYRKCEVAPHLSGHGIDHDLPLEPRLARIVMALTAFGRDQASIQI